MKQKPKVTQRVLLLSMAILTALFVFGSNQTVEAASSQVHNQIPLNQATLNISMEARAENILSSQECLKEDLTTYNDTEILVYRWEALATFYSADQDLTTLGAGDISAYRWEAMAKFYVANKYLTTLDAGEILTYRWLAMAEFYMSPQTCPA